VSNQEGRPRKGGEKIHEEYGLEVTQTLKRMGRRKKCREEK